MNRISLWTGTVLMGMTLVVNQLPCAGAEDEKPKSDNSKATTPPQKDAPRQAFLGVMVEELHPAFASHLPGTGAKGQGLMVIEVGRDSPASKAGIKQHDILMTYDDQKLFTPEQFIKLIHSDRPSREVSFGLIREGKQVTEKVALGERDPKWDQQRFAHYPHHMRPFGWHWPGHTQSGQSQQPMSDSDHPQWSFFDSLSLKKLDKNRFHASVSFTDKDGKVQKKEFEGTRDEIRKKIDDDKDLMLNERNHLVRALDFESDIPILFLPEEQETDF